MDAAMLRNLVVVQSGGRSTDSPFQTPSAPTKAVPRTYPGAPQREDSIELQRVARHEPPSGPSGPTVCPTDDEDLEMSRPSSPMATGEVVESMPSIWDPYMNRFRLLAACTASLGNALNDAAAGALIPYMEKYYNIGYAVVSLIFVGQAMGFAAAALTIDTLRARLGRARLLGLAQALFAFAYVPLVATAPFPCIVISFFFVGFGSATNIAMGNIFCGSLQNGTFMLGLLHGSYGIGGTLGPLLATALVTVAGAIWSRYYLLTLSVGVLTSLLFLWSFWRFEAEQSPSVRQREAQRANSILRAMMDALRLKTVFLGAIFIFAYQGAEVSISGWVISFLINARHGDPSSVGYVSAGFWAGITLGRFLLSVPAQKIGEKVFVYGLVAGAIAFELLVWLVPNIVGDAVALAIVGLLLGPIYPCAAAVFMRRISRRQALSGMSTISACGSLGGAAAPFLTGLLAQAVGTFVLHPIVITLFVVMLLCWYCIPTQRERED